MIKLTKDQITEMMFFNYHFSYNEADEIAKMLEPLNYDFNTLAAVFNMMFRKQITISAIAVTANMKGF